MNQIAWISEECLGILQKKVAMLFHVPAQQANVQPVVRYTVCQSTYRKNAITN